MHYLFLCILSSTSIFIIFKILDRKNLASFPVIVVNYLVATVFGFLLGGKGLNVNRILESDWLVLSILIGLLFILMFLLVSLSSREAGISVTTVAAKMSVIFPIIFSIYINDNDRLNPMKLAAIILTLLGVSLTVWKPGKGKGINSRLILPIILFVGMGLVDSLVKFAQERYVSDSDTALFSAVLFLNAFACGVLLLLLKPGQLKAYRSSAPWFWGLLLGLVNFGSIYFIVRALNYVSPAGSGIDSSVVFGINNIGIVALSVLAGSWLFREGMLRLNWLGISFSLLALFLFAFG